ncbi:uncharacterized [Tachysurus ichikawai]
MTDYMSLSLRLHRSAGCWGPQGQQAPLGFGPHLKPAPRVSAPSNFKVELQPCERQCQDFPFCADGAEGKEVEGTF